MADNRNKKRHHQHQRYRIKGGALYRLLIFIVILFVLILGCAVFFRIDHIEISGNVEYTDEEIIDSSGVSVGENLFFVNKHKVMDQILTDLPYVSTVTVVRDLPDTLRIEVEESDAVAAVPIVNGYAIINSLGKVTSVSEQSDSYAIVDGLDVTVSQVGHVIEVQTEEETKLQSFLKLVQGLEEYQLVDAVTAYSLENDMIVIQYGENITGRFLYNEDYDYDIRAFSTAMEYVKEGEIKTIDLTYQDGVHIYTTEDTQ